MKLKQKLIKMTSAALVLVLLLACMPMSASAKTVTIKLKVKSGQDIVTAFNNATAKAQNDSKNHYKIIVPAGSYKAKNQLKLWSNTTLVLNGVTIKHTSGATTMFRLGNKSDWDRANGGKGYPGYSGYKNITIQGGVLDGGGHGQAIIRFGHSTNIRLEGVTFKNVKNNHHVEIGGCRDVVITGCVFSDFKGSWGAKRNYEALQIEALTADHFSAYYPNSDETPCENILVEGCSFNNLQRGMGTHTGVANSFFNNMVIRNNSFTNITGYAIITTNYINSVISGNAMANCGAGITMRTMETGHNNFYSSKYHSNASNAPVNVNCVIENNAISIKTGHEAKYKNTAYGIQLFGEYLSRKKGKAPKGDFRIQGVTIRGNVVKLFCTGYPIWLSGAIGCVASGNVVKLHAQVKSAGSNCDCIRIDGGGYHSILANRISNSTKNSLANTVCGVMISKAPGCYIANNTVKKMRLDGIKLYQSTGSTIEGNIVSRCSRDGICVSTLSGATIKKNIIKKETRHGVNVTAGSKIKILSNRITGCGGNGINADKKHLAKENGNAISVRGKTKSWL